MFIGGSQEFTLIETIDSEWPSR